MVGGRRTMWVHCVTTGPTYVSTRTSVPKSSVHTVVYSQVRIYYLNKQDLGTLLVRHAIELCMQCVSCTVSGAGSCVEVAEVLSRT